MLFRSLLKESPLGSNPARSLENLLPGVQAALDKAPSRFSGHSDPPIMCFHLQ